MRVLYGLGLLMCSILSFEQIRASENDNNPMRLENMEAIQPRQIRPEQVIVIPPEQIAQAFNTLCAKVNNDVLVEVSESSEDSSSEVEISSWNNFFTPKNGPMDNFMVSRAHDIHSIVAGIGDGCAFIGFLVTPIIAAINTDGLNASSSLILLSLGAGGMAASETFSYFDQAKRYFMAKRDHEDVTYMRHRKENLLFSAVGKGLLLGAGVSMATQNPVAIKVGAWLTAVSGFYTLTKTIVYHSTEGEQYFYKADLKDYMKEFSKACEYIHDASLFVGGTVLSIGLTTESNVTSYVGLGILAARSAQVIYYLGDWRKSDV